MRTSGSCGRGASAWATCPCWRSGSPSLASSGWELYAPTEYVLTLWDTLMTAGERRRASAGGLSGDRRDAPGEGIPGLGFRHHAGDHAGRGRTRVRGAGGQGRRVHRPRRSARGACADQYRGRDRRGGCAASRSTIPGWSASAPSRSASTDGRSGRVTSGGYGYRVSESIAYAYLPSTVEDGAPVQIGVFGTWRDATVRPSRCSTRKCPRARVTTGAVGLTVTRSMHPGRERPGRCGNPVDCRGAAGLSSPSSRGAGRRGIQVS